MSDVRLPSQTAAAGTALFELLKALGDAIPELADSLARGARVSFDTNEMVLLVNTINPDGNSSLLLALRCDPGDADTFGVVAVPVPVAGMFDPATQWH